MRLIQLAIEADTRKQGPVNIRNLLIRDGVPGATRNPGSRRTFVTYG